MNTVRFIADNMKILEVMKRTSEETLNDYVVVKTRHHVKMQVHSCLKSQKRGSRVTFVCFHESLIPVLVVGKVYLIEGDIEFSWGSTYLSIHKLYDLNGKRVLREEESIKEDTDLIEIPF